MTDNDKLLAWQDNGSTPGKPSPDYLNDDTAVMSLLDTLVEKGYEPTIQYHKEMGWWVDITKEIGEWADTCNEAVVAAVLELIEKEGKNV